MEFSEPVRSFLHNYTWYRDPALQLVEEWIQKYYPNVYKYTSTVSYVRNGFELNLSLSIDLSEFREVIEEQDWADVRTEQDESGSYLIVENTQKEISDDHPEKRVQGVFKHNQNGVVVEAAYDSDVDELLVLHADEQALKLLELYFLER